MNLFLSLQAAYAAPIIIMSQNRQIAHDRLEAHNDFLVNQKAEEEICLLIHKVEAQSEEIQKIGAQLKDKRIILFVGRGTMYPVAMEGALKEIRLRSCF